MENSKVNFSQMAAKLGIKSRALINRINKAKKEGRSITDVVPQPLPRQFRERYCWDKETSDKWFAGRSE